MVTRAGARLSGQERAEQLLDVAEQLFITKGFDRTSMGDVAQAAGVTRPVVYEHHGSKAGLYLAAMERARRSLAREYAAAVEGLEEPRDVLRASAGVWFSIVERDPASWVLLYGGAAVPLTGDLGEQLNRIQHANLDIYLSGVGGWVRPGSSASDVSLAVQVLFGLAYSVARWWIASPHVSKEEVVDRYTEVCWAALAPFIDDPA